jgi:hypothetical protein
MTTALPTLAKMFVSTRGRVMIIRDVLALSGLALVLSAGTSYSGPCTQQISDVRSAAIETMNAKAAAGQAGTESTAATLHHQPTPRSIAQAEEGLAEMSDKDAEAYHQAMERAMAADKARACLQSMGERIGIGRGTLCVSDA